MRAMCSVRFARGRFRRQVASGRSSIASRARFDSDDRLTSPWGPKLRRPYTRRWAPFAAVLDELGLATTFNAAMGRDLETAGVHLVKSGLFWVFVVAGYSLFRPEDEPWITFLVLYLFAFGMVGVGVYLLKRAGAWPPR